MCMISLIASVALTVLDYRGRDRVKVIEKVFVLVSLMRRVLI